MLTYYITPVHFPILNSSTPYLTPRMTNKTNLFQPQNSSQGIQAKLQTPALPSTNSCLTTENSEKPSPSSYPHHFVPHPPLHSHLVSKTVCSPLHQCQHGSSVVRFGEWLALVVVGPFLRRCVCSRSLRYQHGTCLSSKRSCVMRWWKRIGIEG
jgi:hypothetical protein